MSLYYIFTHSFTLPEEYQCSENLPFSNERHPLLASYYLTSGVIFLILYFMCFLAILKLNLKVPVNQLMLLLSIFDILAISMNSMTAGIFGILGISFCHYPIPIFIYGAIGEASWLGGSICSILLAIERCAEINPHFPLEILFREWIFPFVLGALIVYSLCALVFVKPVLFSIHFGSWFFDPMLGRDPELYECHPDTINNIALVMCTTPLYCYLSYNLIFKFGYSTSSWLYKSKRQIIFQAAMLCIFHAIVAGFYDFMSFFYVSTVLIITGQILWGWSSGSMCIIYLLFNRTIRNSVIKMVIPKAIRIRNGLHVGFEEHLAQTEAANRCRSELVNAAGSVVKLNNFVTLDN